MNWATVGRPFGGHRLGRRAADLNCSRPLSDHPTGADYPPEWASTGSFAVSEPPFSTRSRSTLTKYVVSPLVAACTPASYRTPPTRIEVLLVAAVNDVPRRCPW